MPRRNRNVRNRRERRDVQRQKTREDRYEQRNERWLVKSREPDWRAEDWPERVAPVPVDA